MNNLKLKIKNLALDSKIFVAGGTGLVGSAIIKNLLEKGYTNIISNYRNRQPNNSTFNIQHSTLNTNEVSYVKLDLLDTLAVSEFFEQHKPEFVFLAAAKVGGIVANNTYRADFIYENLQIQNNVIHQSYVHGVKKLLFLGSTCIYPKNAPQPMKEDSLLTSELEYTNEPYAIAKIAGIKMCESYNIQYGTNFISVMPTNLYGPNDNFDLEKSHVLPALIRKIYLGKCLEENNWEAIKNDLNENPIENIDGSASEEEMLTVLEKYGIKKQFNIQNLTFKISIEIWGSGLPRREFLWSEDMADACVFLLENRDFTDTYNKSNKEVKNTHINIGTGKDISIKELSKLIAKIIGYKGIFTFNTDKPDGAMVKLTDPSKLHSLGWKHKVELEDGIKTIYDWYLSN
ncbi:GDP-L-fucose synthase [Aliarcobacter cryaerophilus]|uniref:GDP-L-fucose synthase family protein n=1 Tax=Aliarcobacter cryaerophilus TaxID=28198 RepID=UPI003DA34532